MRRLGLFGGFAAALAASVAFMLPTVRLSERAATPPPAPAADRAGFKKRARRSGRLNQRDGRSNNPRGTVSNRGLKRIQGRQRARP